MAITLIPEDGTFVANANTYVTLAEANTYHSDRGNESWGDTDVSERQAALVRATQDLETLYRNKWVGVKTQAWEDSSGNPGTPKQYLAWPRVEVADETDPTLLRDVDGIKIAATEIPTAVKNAQMEFALIELTNRVLSTALEEAESVKKVKVGPIEQEFYESNTNRSEIDAYPHIDMILAGLVPAGGAFSGLEVKIGMTDEEANQFKTYKYWEDPAWFVQI